MANIYLSSNSNSTKDKVSSAVIVVLAWNFFDDIKKNNAHISDNFISIKDLEN